MKSNSAAFQQLQKLEIKELDENPEYSPDILLQEISELNRLLHTVMFSSKLLSYSLVPYHSNIKESIVYLKSLIDSLSQSLCIEIPEPLKNDSSSTFNTLKKIIKVPIEGLYLKQSECKEISSLIIGNVRDPECTTLKEKLRKSQQQTENYSKTILELHVKLEAKEKEIIYLYDEIDNLNEQICKTLAFKCKNPIKGKFSVESTCTSVNFSY
jgi:hypothetical protein